MNVQSALFTRMGNNYLQTGREAANNTKGANNSSNTINSAVSSNSQFDKMIESIQEQIQRIQENDRYDVDTKKSKIEELEKQLKDIEKVKAEQLNESALGKGKKTGDNKNTGNIHEESNTDGDKLDLSLNAKALLEADNSLKSLKSAHAIKVKLVGEGSILESEIKADKGRGVDTSKKEEHLAKVKKGVENSLQNLGKAISGSIESGNEISETTQILAESNDSIDKKESSPESHTNSAESNAKIPRRLG